MVLYISLGVSVRIYYWLIMQPIWCQFMYQVRHCIWRFHKFLYSLQMSTRIIPQKYPTYYNPLYIQNSLHSTISAVSHHPLTLYEKRLICRKPTCLVSWWLMIICTCHKGRFSYNHFPVTLAPKPYTNIQTNMWRFSARCCTHIQNPLILLWSKSHDRKQAWCTLYYIMPSKVFWCGSNRDRWRINNQTNLSPLANWVQIHTPVYKSLENGFKLN